MTTELTWSYNGEAIAGESPLGAAWTVNIPKGGVLRPPSLVTLHHHVALLDAMVDVVPSRLHPERDWGLVIEADVTGLSGSVMERKLTAGWEELAATFRPTLGVVALACTKKDLAGDDVVRHILVENHQAPSYTPRTGDPAGLEQAGAYESGLIVYPIGGRTLFPYWVGSTLLDQDTSDADAELAVDASSDSVTIENPGDRWAGLRIEVKAGSVSGSVTQFQIENDANGDVIVLDNQASFGAGDGIDWCATDPRRIEMLDDDTTFAGIGIGRIRIEPGENLLTVSRLGGTGTLTLSLSWTDLRLTL